MDKANKRKKQIQIYRIIAENPGIHLSKIAELLNLHISEVKQHLQFLERHKIIHTIQDTGYTRFYIDKNTVGSRAEQSQGIRDNIYRYIEKNPGIHLSKIASTFDMRISHAEYHLMHLEKNKKINGVKDEKGYYKRYYTTECDLGIENKKLFALLRQEIPSIIISLLLKKSPLQHREIMPYLDLDPSTLSYHIKKLVKQGIIEVKTYSSKKGYTLKNKKEITNLLLKYEFNKYPKKFRDVWTDFHS